MLHSNCRLYDTFTTPGPWPSDVKQLHWELCTYTYQLKVAIEAESQLKSPSDKLKPSAGKPEDKQYDLYELEDEQQSL